MVMVWVMQLIFTFSGSGHISGVDEARQFNLVCRLNVKSTGITLVKVLQHGVHFRSCDLLKFWEISANISETVQDRHIVTYITYIYTPV